PEVAAWLAELLERQRVLPVSIAGEQRVAAAEDAARLRDALGVAVPVGLPTSFTDPVDTPLRDLVERYARTHGPFTTPEIVRRLGASTESVAMALDVLVDAGRIVSGEFRPGGVHSEWCDADVLRQIRRRSLAALRNEVAPVEGTALARFLPRWQGVGSSLRGVDAVADTIGVLQGAAIPASLLEVDVLGLRVAGYQPSDLDLLCTTGEVVWLGAGSVGAHDGRVRLVFRDQVPVLVPEPGDALEPLDHHDVLRAHLAERGASFWGELVAATAAAKLPYDDETVLAALWDLVWAGEVTNDSLAPLRAKVAGGSARRASGARSRRPRGGTVRRHARGSVAGPPAAAGRWSSTAPLFEPRPSPTEAITQRALQLLERYGVLTREMALAEGAEGGFAGVYPVLKLLEERGQVRRGYFVDGLGAAQFAKPGAVDLLRAAGRTDDGSDAGSEADPLQSHAMPWEPAASAGDAPEELVLAATDPAQPYGAALPWPESTGHPARAVGAYVVLIDGTACAYLERGGTSVLTFPGAAAHDRWPSVLAQLVRTGRVRRLRVQSVDGVSVASSPVVDELSAAGFVDGYKGMTLGT
ncbi:MAG: DEAD/DEAH box helicase, partial [Actinomycetota bacterium]|nr:DEAD/DEAH box helicase [Actinomycetota bacterium]